MQFLWRYIDELIGKGLEFKVIGEFLLYTSATLVPMALPLSILMSSLMTFGNLGEKYELTAMKASGISLQKIMKPMVISVVFVSIGTFFFANNVLPYANLQMRSLLHDIRQQRPELQLKPGEFNNLIDGYSIRIQEKDPKTNAMYGIQIYDHSEGRGNVSVIFADSGSMKMTTDEQSLLMTLYDGHSYNELQDPKIPDKKKSYPHRYDKFEKQEFLIRLSGFNLERSDQSLFKNHYAMMTLTQLEYMIDSLNKEIISKEEHIFNTLVNVNLFKNRDSKNVNVGKPKSGNREQAPKKSSKLIGPRVVTSTAKEVSKDTLKNTPTKPSPKIKEAAPPDTSTTKLLAKKAKIINVDSLFDNLTLREKSRVASNALTYTRTSKNLITNSLQTLDFKTHNLRRHEIEWHRKFTISFACLVFLFIGAPLGAIIRKGGLGLPLVLSVLFFILYYILSLTGEKIVRESIITSLQGMWMTSAIFALTGGFLTYQATTDASMLNLDTYLNFLKKYFGQRYNVVDKLSIQAQVDTTHKAKVSHIKSSLVTLQDNVSSAMKWTKNNSTVSDTLISLFSLNSDNELILFERYYNNTFRILINHPVFHDKSVRSKVYEFPSFNHNDYADKSWKLVVKVVLACLPPITLLVWIRQIIKMTLLDLKLKKIKQLIPELVSILNITFPDNVDENTTTMQ